ncbi:unnamed protein product [Rotaria sp. Silwood1]|nr:unnamed protein product [Rotaria sp. Silwood1]
MGNVAYHTKTPRTRLEKGLLFYSFYASNVTNNFLLEIAVLKATTKLSEKQIREMYEVSSKTSSKDLPEKTLF